MREAQVKVRAAVIAAVTAGVLAVAKLGVAIFTGSLAVLAAAVDSLMDVAASGLNAFFLRIAADPPDAEHAYGHGKAEALSGVIQAVIIAMGGLWLLVRGVVRLVRPEPVTQPLVGVGVAGVSLVVSVGLVAFLRRQARRTGSVALEADAFHYVTDLATNVVAGVALLGYRYLGWGWLDPIASLLIAGYIVKESLGIVRTAGDELLDRGLPYEVEADVKQIIRQLAPEVKGYRSFRSRVAGGVPFFEFRLLVERDTTFERSHELAEEVMRRIKDRHGEDTQVMVDTDPV